MEPTHAMPLEALEQALAQAKLGDAEVDAVDVISRLLELPRTAVLRVLFARSVFKDQRDGLLPDNHYNEIPEEIRDAMRKEIRRGSLRILTANAISANQPMYTEVKNLTKKHSDVCKGCPFSMRCVVDSYSTPDDCFRQGPPASIQMKDGKAYLMRYGHGAMVYPFRIRGDLVSVQSEHPHGTYDVDVGVLHK